MNGSMKLPIIGRVDTKSVLVGAGVMLAAMVLPKISDFTVDMVSKLRNTIGGAK